MTSNPFSSFYVVTHETGADRSSVPVWANRAPNPAGLEKKRPGGSVVGREVSDVPGAFQLLGVLDRDECQRLIALSENLGYLADAAISLPREIRHNDSVVWVTDAGTDGIIWERIAPLVAQNTTIADGKSALGLNARFRFYRYGPDDFFKFHSDGDWPGSRVIDGELVSDAYPDRFSLMSFLLLLNDDYGGGATRFLVNADDPSRPARRYSRVREVDVRTPAGAALCFPHGRHPLQCVHSGETITRGTKYIIRTDILFER